MQGRGLKHPPMRVPRRPMAVAPHAGAWIETCPLQPNRLTNGSPLIQGRELHQGTQLVTDL